MFHVIHRTPMGVIKTVDVEASTIEEVVELLDIPVTQFPTVCVLGDKPVLRKHWKTIDSELSDAIKLEAPSKDLTFITIPQGKAFRSILGLVATIALTIAAPWAAGFLAPVLGITSQIGLQLLQAGIVLAGSFLIGTFLGPTAPSVRNQQSPEAASPTYSLTGQANQARLFQAIPRLYGKHIIYPDYAAQPYSEYVGNQQYLNQLFCLGLGEYQIHQMRIEDTEFWNETDGMTGAFTGINYEIIPPGQAVTLFHSQVITSIEVSGQDLVKWSIDGTFTITASNKRITGPFVSLAVPGQKIKLSDGPNANQVLTINSIATDLTWIEVVEPVSNFSSHLHVFTSDDDNWAGPYVANPADTITNKLQIDYIMPNGIFYTTDDGGLSYTSVTVICQLRLIDSAGLPLGPWTNLGNHTYTSATLTPQRITETYTVPDGRYELRVRRATNEDPSTRIRSTVQWGGLKAYIPNDNIYPDVTLVAMRMLATGQLTQNSSRKVNIIQTSKLPIQNDDGTWTAPVPTRSIAWIAADILRNDVYGADYGDAYIDYEKLRELDETWQDRGDTFNGVFDNTQSVWDALTSVLRTGRTVPVMVGGKVTFMRDELRLLPRGVFTPSNIVRGSVNIQHILFDDESPDDIIVQFLDERTWQQNEVQCTQEDSLSEKPERMNIFGITDRLQAWREGMFLGAVNAKRRVVTSFTSEMEGRLLLRGDTISVGTDLFEGTQTGQVTGYDSSTRIIWLSEPIEWNDSTDSYIQLRKRNGKSWGPVKIHPTGDSYKAVIDATDLILIQASQGSIISTFNHDTDGAITNYILCTAETDYKDFIIVSGTPKDETVELTCIIEDPNVHLADLGTPPPETYPFTGQQDPARPIISFFGISEALASNPAFPTVVFAWAPSTTATSYNLEISYDNVTWDQIYQGPSTSFTSQVFAGALFARVHGVNTQSGPWKMASGVFGNNSGEPLPTGNVTYSYGVNEGFLAIAWDNAIRATSYRVKVYSETSPGSGVFDHVALTTDTIANTVQYNSSEIIGAGGPWPAIRLGITSINDAGQSTEVTRDIAGITLDPVTSLSLQSPYNRDTFVVQWAPSNANSYDVLIIVDGVTKITANSLTNSQTITLSAMQAVGGPWRVFTVRVIAKAGILTSPPTNLLVVGSNILPVTGAGGFYDGTEVDLSWNQSPDNGVGQTRVRRNNVNDFASATIINTQSKAPGAATTYSDPRAVGSGTWYYYITAYDNVRNLESPAVTLSVTV